jgi:Sec-independent protein translocase protein TatA
MSKLIRAVRNCKTLSELTSEKEKQARANSAEKRRQKRQVAATAALQKTWLGKRA